MSESLLTQDSYLGINVPPLPDSLIPIIALDLDTFPTRASYPEYLLIDDLQKSISRIQPEASNLHIMEAATEISADYALACHPLAKVLRQSPQQIAEEIAAQFTPLTNEALGEVSAQNGYINFVVENNTFGNQILQNIENLNDNYGEINLGNGKTVVIDCSSPNVAKFMSVGHLRSTVIGESLARIWRATGHEVIRDNHLGDWGTQFGMLVAAHERWSDEYEEIRDNTNPVQGLYKLYVRIHEESEKERLVLAAEQGITDPEKIKDIETSLEKEGREWFHKLEGGDKTALELLKWSTTQSLAEFQKIYDQLGTKYEYMLGESFYVGMLPEIVQFLRDKHIATDNADGSVVVDLEQEKLNRLIVQKKDGSSLYSTRDLATIVARVAWFHPKRIIYVVGGDQTEYFKQLFVTSNKMTDGTGPELEHVSFGLIKIKLPDEEEAQKMSTRAGRVVFLGEVLDLAINKAREKTNQVSGQLSETERESIAQKVGVGAVIFSDLGQGRERNIDFDVEKAITFEGKSAGYIQYAHARASSLIRRATDAAVQINNDEPVILGTDSETNLVKHLGHFPEAIIKAQDSNNPSVIAEYTYQAASMFSDFYRENSVFNEPDPNIRNGRLRIARAAAQVIKNGLNLLCIEAPERM
ncbi:MAG: arginine--tRNA ligase [Candidatus Daviesbacteria bacterium]|nr:arginine--tRNA ligase [Candidatus Daviesbacteria bacterium]